MRRRPIRPCTPARRGRAAPPGTWRAVHGAGRGQACVHLKGCNHLASESCTGRGACVPASSHAVPMCARRNPKPQTLASPELERRGAGIGRRRRRLGVPGPRQLGGLVARRKLGRAQVGQRRQHRLRARANVSTTTSLRPPSNHPPPQGAAWRRALRSRITRQRGAAAGRVAVPSGKALRARSGTLLDTEAGRVIQRATWKCAPGTWRWAAAP